jgi:DinB superfamily
MTRGLLFFAISMPLLAGNPVTDTVKGAYARMKQNLIETAEAMPETGYAYRLTKEQRPFGEWILHTASGNYNYCSSIRGQQPPEAAKSLGGITAKSEIQQALKQSFDYCDAALNEMDDQKAVVELTIGERKVTPIQSMIGLVGFLNEHYGNLVGYLRTKGIVPPSTARAAQKK